MTRFQSLGWLFAGALILVSMALPASAGLMPAAETGAGASLPVLASVLLPLAGMAFIAAGLARRAAGVWLYGMVALLAIATIALLTLASSPFVSGQAGAGIWLKAAGLWLAGWMSVDMIANAPLKRGSGRLRVVAARAAPPFLFGATVLALWELLVVGLGVSPINLLAPSAIADAVVRYGDLLFQDFVWTVRNEVLLGWLIGCGSGFLAALLTDRVPFLRRGLLPLGNAVSALPIVGIAPIMIWWFSYDWPSKTAVVVAMTFFPMLVNTVAGLSASGNLERDLMRSYGASYRSTLVCLRLPAAMPFIFNGLKINSTLAMIGAIVAEYFDGPTIGMGFRINTQAALARTDIVWAEIAVAMIAGSLFYGIIALVERAVTFWHPSYRHA